MSVRDTSINAFREVKTELGARQHAVYNAIKTLVCPTNTEIAGYLTLPINQVTPRTNELVKKGYVIEYEKRKCSVTGKTVWSWKLK